MTGRVRTALVGGLSVALFLIGALGVFTTVRRGPSPAAGGAARSGPPAPLVLANGSLSDTIEGLQSRLKVVPQDWGSWASLGQEYVQQARVTGDPTFYPRAEAALRRSIELKPDDNFGALTGLGALALARHDFAGALGYGERARALNPYNSTVYGVIGDAQIELGRYREALASFQKMVDLKPNLSSYARASYAHELQGDTRGALAIMELAFEAAADANDRAWALNQMGELSFNAGDLAQAETSYRRARAADPSFLPPLAGLAKVAWARGHTAEAIALYGRVTERYPLPEYVIALGDLYTVTGQDALARRTFEVVQVEEQLLQANGVNVDLEIALFGADHGFDLANGLAAARAEWERRHSVHVADALAWELYASKDYGEALRYSEEATRLGYRNALFHFHRAMIERALGRAGPARADLRMALDINPHFSILWAKRAATILASMDGRP